MKKAIAVVMMVLFTGSAMACGYGKWCKPNLVPDVSYDCSYKDIRGCKPEPKR